MKLYLVVSVLLVCSFRFASAQGGVIETYRPWACNYAFAFASAMVAIFEDYDVFSDYSCRMYHMLAMMDSTEQCPEMQFASLMTNPCRGEYEYNRNPDSQQDDDSDEDCDTDETFESSEENGFGTDLNFSDSTVTDNPNETGASTPRNRVQIGHHHSKSRHQKKTKNQHSKKAKHGHQSKSRSNHHSKTANHHASKSKGNHHESKSKNAEHHQTAHQEKSKAQHKN